MPPGPRSPLRSSRSWPPSRPRSPPRTKNPAPATIAAAPTTRVKALDLLFRGSTVPASYDAPSYAIVMTGHFASYRGGPHRSQIKLPRRGRCLVVIIDASTPESVNPGEAPSGGFY